MNVQLVGVKMIKATTLGCGNLRGSAHAEYNQLNSPEVFILGKKRSESNLWVFHRDFLIIWIGEGHFLVLELG